MTDYEDVCALVPTRNESKTIGNVVDGLRDAGVDNVLVVDGHSRDQTREIARDKGARVIEQSGEGKGQAVRQGVSHIDSEYVLLLDGDATNPPEQAPRLLDPLVAGDADHVVGDRTADMQPGAMSRLNQVGNKLINRAFVRIHGEDYGDILSGYRAFTTDSFDRMFLSAEGFGIETEMAVECARHGIPVEVVPTTYRPRPEGSETNLHPISDGARIILTLYSLAKTSNPLFYFGSIGAGFGALGTALAAWIGYEWFVRGISHEALTVVAGVVLLLGVQLLIFGVLSDLVVTLHREQARRIERLQSED
ncbi:S-layer glycoprotein N-glycosyltransferase AglJ [Halobacterium salinarum]|uniref:Dolichol-phosphate mannosyltransferase n=1 Tax=Halobacterium salinarum (strain ATCC 33171 / DSM 3754 / JCM 8978 / NBRC 102687 / NCIMB 764 / 91-R6) TaxID=2597657 RepID=A0A4D6GWE9_HALS9|nr:S-layer glycoprotein N-glycosyltransferase AglJ [Halobacterium salinarum]QCC44898.1 dolichyl-phosphate glucosyltransferase AglJ [Halobacterium salinarum]TYO71452.1 dolichol-phosphate mannosyltransferase [Halobacterium salinarum DSM 3754]